MSTLPASHFTTDLGKHVDASGNIYSTGRFWDTADFDPGPGTFNLTSASPGVFDVFVTKLDSAGDFVWARSMGGSGRDGATKIALDASSNVYTTGEFSATVDFDPGPGTANLTSAGDRDAFVAKLDSAGDFVWARGMGGSGLDIGTSIALDGSENVYTTGGFTSTVDFDPGPGIENLASAGSRDAFVSKLDKIDVGTGQLIKQLGQPRRSTSQPIESPHHDRCDLRLQHGQFQLPPARTVHRHACCSVAGIATSKNSTYYFSRSLAAALLTVSRYRISRFSLDLKQVERKGVEPSTSALRTLRSPN